jgi:hypothetical protein
VKGIDTRVKSQRESHEDDDDRREEAAGDNATRRPGG